MGKYKAILVYSYENTIGLDKDFINQVSGNTSNAFLRVALVEEYVLKEMVKRKGINFDYEYHSKLVSEMNYDEADKYHEENRKNILLDEFVNVIVLPFGELNKQKIKQYLVDDELDIEFEI